MGISFVIDTSHDKLSVHPVAKHQGAPACWVRITNQFKYSSGTDGRIPVFLQPPVQIESQFGGVGNVCINVESKIVSVLTGGRPKPSLMLVAKGRIISGFLCATTYFDIVRCQHCIFSSKSRPDVVYGEYVRFATVNKPL